MTRLSSKSLSSSVNPKSTLNQLPVNAGLYIVFWHCFSCAAVLVANFGCDESRIMPEILSNLLLNDTWSGSALFLESEQSPFSQTGRWFRSTAELLLCSEFNLELMDLFLSLSFTQCELSNDWERWWMLLWSVTSSSMIMNEIPISHEEQKNQSLLPTIYNALDLFSLETESA